MSDKSNFEKEQASSFLWGGSAAYLEDRYESFLENPTSVDPTWQDCFESLPQVPSQGKKEVPHGPIRQAFLHFKSQPASFPSCSNTEGERKQSYVTHLIHAYRSEGHLQAALNPLPLGDRPSVPDLQWSYQGLESSDLTQCFATNSFFGLPHQSATLEEIVGVLNKIYCGSIGIEYMHISNHEETRWIQQYMESAGGVYSFSAPEKKRILEKLIAAEGLERYLGNKYVGQKRFSLEGGEALIPLLDTLTQKAVEGGTKELVLGMAHRGRLNVLINVLGKSPEKLFSEFEGKFIDKTRSGDVKYHLGFSSDLKTPQGTLHITLGFNPSHLEIISPVVEGSVRARQDRREDCKGNVVIPIVIHGDAAFAGQGVVMETFNMSQARGYRTGGTLHIVINNQIGFTTSNPLDARSTLYCTDVAKMVQAPVIHVNGDDPEAVVFAARFAFDYRERFHKDVVIDLVCYRRHGHNESDEPAITQPLMYHAIREHDTTPTLYGNQLVKEGILSSSQVSDLVEAYRKQLDEGKTVVPLVPHNELPKRPVDWTPYLDKEWDTPYVSTVPLSTLKNIANAMLELPKGFILQKQVQREWDARISMAKGEGPIFWGFAENLAYATLLMEGHSVRLSGQDCGRGTFTHRHGVLHEVNSGEVYIPLQHLQKDQGHFTIIDSILSEEAVLAFEYGYATAEPCSLVIWEAQFGDFVNGAQVVIDQFISSGYQKWGRLCGLTLFLPHGYEGMGPEHSSARLERFLQLCAEHNMQVCVPTTPAQAYHMIRRQAVRPYRKPLIVMTPKSLLRHKLATSTLKELAEGTFQTVIGEIDDLNPEKVTRVVMCSGKVYYDLLQKRREQDLKHIAILRVEQLYPFPKEALKNLLKAYPKAETMYWCQEEPQNQGAWYATQHHVLECLEKNQKLFYAGRPASAAPAVGSAKVHEEQQIQLVKDALGIQ